MPTTLPPVRGPGVLARPRPSLCARYAGATGHRALKAARISKHVLLRRTCRAPCGLSVNTRQMNTRKKEHLIHTPPQPCADITLDGSLPAYRVDEPRHPHGSFMGGGGGAGEPQVCTAMEGVRWASPWSLL